MNFRDFSKQQGFYFTLKNELDARNKNLNYSTSLQSQQGLLSEGENPSFQTLLTKKPSAIESMGSLE